MQEMDYLELNGCLAAEHSAECVAWYSIPLSRITFGETNPFSYKVPYKLSRTEFDDRLSEIGRALTTFHELTHFLQSWSTTVGILDFLYFTSEYRQLIQIQKHADYQLPLEDYFANHIASIQTLTRTTEHDFFRWYIAYKYQVLNRQWLLGTIPSDIVREKFAERIQMYLPNVFGVASLKFLSQDLDRLYGMDNKAYPLYNVLSSSLKIYNNPIVIPIGALHLFECFAKSVEFEHLLWFNTERASEIIGDWMSDDAGLTYNAPFRLLEQILEHPDKSALRFIWAHLRIFIDIALMYSDFLNILPEEVSEKGIINRINAVRVHPGQTFYKVLRAFRKVPVLKDQEEDVLRLYDDLCHILRFPPLERMLYRLLALVDSFLEIQFENSPIRPIFLAAHELVTMKINDPRLFINDLIHPNRIHDVLNSVWHLMTIEVPGGTLRREGSRETSEHAMRGVILEAMNKVSENFLRSTKPFCPLHRDYGGCLLGHKGGNHLAPCAMKNRFDNNCPIGSFVNRWLEGDSTQ